MRDNRVKNRTEIAWMEIWACFNKPTTMKALLKQKVNIQTKSTESIGVISREHFSNLTIWVFPFPLFKKVHSNWKKFEHNIKKCDFWPLHPLFQPPTRRNDPTPILMPATDDCYLALEDTDLKMGILISFNSIKPMKLTISLRCTQI